MTFGLPHPPQHESAGLATGFQHAVDRWGDRPALVIDGHSLSYAELGHRAATLAHTIQQQGDGGSLTAVLGQRSVAAYSGILGALLAGTGYVPLHPKFPVARLCAMLNSSASRCLIAGPEAFHLLPELLAGSARSLLVILPEGECHQLREAFPRHRFAGRAALAHGALHALAPRVADQDIAYLLFTSGTTGTPKGVPVNHGNVRAYIQHACARYDVTPDDRFSQMFDLTFDLSVHDMFLCWERGAGLHCVPARALVAPARFIREHELTIWFSVPSVIAQMARLRMLTPGAFPTLRWSLFCGEPLPAAAAEAWQAAAPESTLENLYGPTEATIAITQYRWDRYRSAGDCANGVVPIGHPFEGHDCAPFTEDGRKAGTDVPGELWLYGRQVTSGYWEDAERTRSQFVNAADGSGPWYRTGDVVRRDQTGCLHYLGRLDQQVKVRGYRVELLEIEAALRTATSATQVAVVAWPVRDGSAEGVVAFAAGLELHDTAEALDACHRFLPDYMVPKTLHVLPELPLNQNGKIDRQALVTLLERMAG